MASGDVRNIKNFPEGSGKFIDFVRILETLLETGALASTFTQEVQAGTAHFVVAFNHQLGDARGIGQEGTFHADTIAGNPADGEAGAIAAAANVEDDALEFLDSLAVTFFDFVVNGNGIARENVWDIGVLFCFN